MTTRISEGHWEVLLQCMESHEDFARGKFVGPAGKSTQKKLWEELATKLNGLGDGSKTTEKWQKSWADMKYNIKKKASAIKQSQAETGGGPETIKSLNQWEQRIINILGKTFYEGVGEDEVGLPQENLQPRDEEENIVVEDEPPEALSAAQGTSGKHSGELDEHNYSQQRKKKKTEVERENELYETTISELRAIKHVLMDINSNLTNISQTLRNK